MSTKQTKFSENDVKVTVRPVAIQNPPREVTITMTEEHARAFLNFIGKSRDGCGDRDENYAVYRTLNKALNS